MDNVISYDDLLRYSDSINLYDKKNKDTLWVRLIFNESERQEIDENLKIRNAAITALEKTYERVI